MATQKQKIAASKVVEKGGKPISKAMVEAGYSPNTAKTPKKLTESKGWHELMQKMLPDKKIAKIHKELLEASGLDHYVFPASVPDKEIKSLFSRVKGFRVLKIKKAKSWKRAYFLAPDNKARKNALDMFYKLKGYYKAEKVKIEDPYADFTTDELLELAKLRRIEEGGS